MIEKSLAKKSICVRISHTLINYILYVFFYIQMCRKYIKLKFAIPLDFCHYVFDTGSPKCLVAIKIVNKNSHSTGLNGDYCKRTPA